MTQMYRKSRVTPTANGGKAMVYQDDRDGMTAYDLEDNRIRPFDEHGRRRYPDNRESETSSDRTGEDE